MMCTVFGLIHCSTFIEVCTIGVYWILLNQQLGLHVVFDAVLPKVIHLFLSYRSA